MPAREAVTIVAAAAVTIVVVLLVVGAPPVGAHGNHVSVDAQASANGTVVIESLFTAAEEGYVALHADNGGEPGRAIGHAPIDYGFHTGLSVDVDNATWAEWNGSRTVWAVLHRDDGDGSFDPGTDEVLSSFGGSASAGFSLGKRAAGPASVAVSGFRSQMIENASVAIRRVALGRSGTLLVRADENGSPGGVVGRVPLDAGVHENVTVPIEASYYRDHGPRFTLWATLEERGDPVAVDGTPVASEFAVRKPAETDRMVNVATTTAASETANGDSATTVSTTVTPDNSTADGTAGAGPGSADSDTDGLDDAVSGAGPGFGVAAVAVTVLVLAGAVAVRDSRR
jgi:hypothetical protein